MGRSKALLPCPPDSGTFLRRAITTLHAGGVADVVVVGRPADRDLEDEVMRSPRAVYLANMSAALGQLSSVLVGIEYAERIVADAVMILPVDMPLVLAAMVRTLLDAFEAAPQPIARAVHRGRHGHPVIVAASLFDELRHADPTIGARAVMRGDPSRILDVDVDDPGVLRDVDTPDDYQALIDERP